MGNDTGLSAASLDYAKAHNAHYGTKDLRRALGLYRDIMAAHPGAQEAGYSRSQIHNIAKSVIPMQELLDAQIALAVSHLGNGDSDPVKVDPVEAVPTGSTA